MVDNKALFNRVRSELVLHSSKCLEESDLVELLTGEKDKFGKHRDARVAIEALNVLERRMDNLESSLARINIERVDIEEALATFLKERGYRVSRQYE